MTDPQASPSPPDMQRSTRDLVELQRRMCDWMARVLGDTSDPEVVVSSAAASNGMSSETVLIDATWTDGTARRCEPLVARLAPAESDVPVFASYDLRRQFETLRLVEQLTSVPVPKMWWMEDDPAAIGSQFFVMSRVEGDVPPDVMPYTFGDNWLFDAPPSKSRVLQDASVAVLADLHAIERPEEVFGFLTFDEPGATALERHVAHTKAWYAYAVSGGGRSRLVERCFEWLDDHRPAGRTETVLSWGDSRIGNVMYRDFLPVAVLDWEMAGLGPRELDVAWMLFAHRVFEELAGEFGLPGMPDFMRVDDVVGAYEHATGATLRDLEFYCTYAAIQWGIVFLRTGMRQAHFDGSALPEDHDDLMHHRGSLERMAEGRFTL